MTVMVEPLTPTEILSRAAKLLESGWCQGKYHDDEGMCAVGAINTVAFGNPEILVYDEYGIVNEHNFAARNAAVTCLADQVRSSVHKIFSYAGVVMSWNDNENQTQQEVIHQFQLAAKIASGE